MICKNNLMIILLLTVFISRPFTVEAQQTLNPKLKAFVGYYQFQQNKALYFQIEVVGNQLKQVKIWDGRAMRLEQQSELDFLDPETQTRITFLKNKQGEVTEAQLNGDQWLKVMGYQPESIGDLTYEQVKSALDKNAEALVAAINTSSGDSLAHFVEEHFTADLKKIVGDNFIQQAYLDYRLTGGLKYYKNTYINQNAFHAEYQYISEDLDVIYEFSINLDQHQKIKLFNGRIIPNPILMNKPDNEKELVEGLEKTFKSLTDKDIFSGAVLLAKGNRVLFQYASGDANKESHIKNTLKTRFNLGSMNKMFTAISVMQLVEKGKLDLNNPVSRYLDSTWLPKQLADKITIHDLLSHTSGLGDFFSKEFHDAPASRFVTLEGYKPFIKTDKINFEPGSDWLYSNTGMLLLGVIIEKASGLDYFDYVKKHIYTPSGMTSSDGWDLTNNLGNTAIGYIPNPDGSYGDNLDIEFTRGSPAGGGYSTVEDLHQFALALKNGTLVSGASKSKLFKDYMNHLYGYSFQLWGSPDQKIVGHSGGAPGVSSIEYIFLDSDYIIILLSNYDFGGQKPGEYLLKQVQAMVK